MTSGAPTIVLRVREEPDNVPDQPIAAAMSRRNLTIATGAFLILAGGLFVLLRIIWPLAPPRTLTGHSGPVYSVAFSPDGRTLAAGGPDTTATNLGDVARSINLWDVASGNLIRTLSVYGSEVDTLAFSPDGRTLVSGGGDTSIKLWDVASGNLIRTLTGHE